MRYLYSLILERTEREEDRGKSLDAKITALLSGVVAFIGFSSRGNVSVWTAGAALLYTIPLAFLFNAFLTKHGKSAPTAESLHRYFPAFPVSTLKTGIDAMLLAEAKNEAVNELKADRVDLATILTGMVTVIVLVAQFILAFEYHNSPPTGGRPTSVLLTPGAAHHGQRP